MQGRAVWASFGAISVLLSSVVAHAQCTKDIDCKGDRVCEAGKCTSPLPAPPPAPPTDLAADAPVEAGAEGMPEPLTATAPSGPAEGRPKLDATPSPMARELPPGAATPLGPDEPELRRRSRPLMITGIVMVSVGPLALLGALAAKNSQEKCDESLEADYPDHRVPTVERHRVERCDSYSLPLYLFGIGGGVLTLGGIPLIIYGGKNVPARSVAAVTVLPWANPESGGLKLRVDL